LRFRVLHRVLQSATQGATFSKAGLRQAKSRDENEEENEALGDTGPPLEVATVAMVAHCLTEVFGATGRNILIFDFQLGDGTDRWRQAKDEAAEPLKVIGGDEEVGRGLKLS
jgi:hypothetical protein